MLSQRSRLVPGFSWLACCSSLALGACGEDESAPIPSPPNDGDSLYLNAMPPGSNGNSAGGIGIPGGSDPLLYPRNFADALALYGDLAYAPPGLRSEPCEPPQRSEQHQKVSPLACNYFKHEGLEPDVVTSEETLTAANGKSVRIRRDAWGVPFIDGEDPVAGARRALARAGLPIPAQLSNFIAVTADQTQTGHPIAVMGPQTAYFVPQLLWEVAISSGGDGPLDFAGRGVVFGNLPYINIGRGLDFAFSATSGNSDLTDVRVSTLCNLDGTPASRDDADADGFPDADGYRVDVGDGEGLACRRFYRRVDEWVAQPSAASVALGGPPTPETVRRYVLRTHYGPVFATATVAGEPVVVSRQRSTFRAEVDTAIPFALATTRLVRSAGDFQRLFNGITGSFNWLYVDSDDVGYLHSGLYPERAPAIHPELPSWGDGRYEWAADAGRLSRAFFDEYGADRPFPSAAVPAEEWVGQERYDAPRAQGSAFQEGWFQHLARVLQMALGEATTPYRELRCADGTLSGCRAAVVEALDQALADLGGFDDRADWTGSPLAPAAGQPVEAYDAVQHRSFSTLGVPPIHWTNRPTFQQAIEVRTRRPPAQ